MGAACKACASGNSTIDRNTQNRDNQSTNIQDDELGENTKPEVNEEKENVNQDKSDGSYNSNEQIDPNSGANEDEKQGLSELNTSVNQSDDPITSKTDLPQSYEPNNGVEEIDDNNQDEDELIVPLKSQVEVEDMSERTLNGNLSAMRQYMSQLESTMNLDTEENISETCKSFLSDYLLKFEEVNNNNDLSSEDRKNARGTIREEAVSQWREQNKDIDDNVLEQQVQFISKGLEDEFYDNTFSSGVRPNINENDDEKLEVEKPEETPNIVTDDDYDNNNDNNQEETTNNDENNDNNDDNKDNSDPQEPENPQSNEEIKENNENTENPPEENYENPPPEENTEEPTEEPQENNEENQPTEENTEENTEEPPPEPNNEEPPQEENNQEPPPQENNEENVDETGTVEPPTDDKPNEEPQNEENNYETGTVEPPKDENVEPEPEPQPVEE